LSAAVLRYLRHLRNGRIEPRVAGLRIDTPRVSPDLGPLLLAAITDNRVSQLAAESRPPLAQYRALREMLRRYRTLAADPTLSQLPADTSVIRPGNSFGATSTLHHLLSALGDVRRDVPNPSDPGRYEGALVDAVRRFQARHGLAPDGVLGKATWASLRLPLSRRVRQIELALERLRWLPDLGAARLVALNIPMFRLWAWDTIQPGGAPNFGMDVIVGRALATETPLFVEEMREVVFRPYWNVPRSILRKEVLPKLERDPDYLRREDMEIVRGAGDDAQRVELTPEAVAELRNGVLRVRQRPGQKNALGLIKFVFPNDEDVYMHGTPAQGLFAKSRRDFSHGCVRVADPVALAEWVLQDRPEWSRERILAATSGSRTIRVTLPQSIQVVFFYTTAAVVEDGTIRFADDIYHDDAELERALANARLAW
jgi:murein L,D-transpeptidase YcbB/YkuD